MHSRDLLTDAFTRVRQLVHSAATGLDRRGLTYRPEPGANSIAWLTWHLTRIQDDHVSEIAGRGQAWVTDGWAVRFGMAPDPGNDGRGHGPEQVAAIAPDSPDLLIAHHDAVSDRTLAYLESVDDNKLDRIIDRSYDPPVSVGVRLVSVISDNIQHAGQARYLRCIVDRVL
ncbi:MAG: DinB family protein [Chloroflexi bacterium]|nr:DinB family protein [Chloroflexota bacterium]MDA1298091.1 DinB family protein [Chloroflexota bacterium]